jgi:Arc/MetJ family transcription regulator
MRTTFTVDDQLMAEAVELTGMTRPSALLQVALETLVRLEQAKRLIALGGADPGAEAALRRQPAA